MEPHSARTSPYLHIHTEYRRVSGPLAWRGKLTASA
jgi:hypothetical protein